MTDKNTLFVIGLAALVICGGYLWFSTTTELSSMDEVTIPTSLEIAQDPSSSPMDAATGHSLVAKSSEMQQVDVDSTDQSGFSQTDVEKDIQHAQAFIEGPAFSSVEQLNAAYLFSDGTVSMQSLTLTFQQDDFTSLITKLTQISSTELAAEREAKLKQTLYDEMGTQINSESYACAGKLCAVTFTSAVPVEQQVINKFAKFSGNYTFTNRVVNSHGESVTRLLLIAADDPSQLTVR